MYYFARFAHNAALGAIKLRFENTLLLTQLQDARDQALAANSAKSKLLAAASHDLRQPLHAMSLFLEALSRGGLSVPQQEIFTNAKLAANASRDLLNTLLDFSRIEAGVINTAPCTFYLQPLFNRLEKELGSEADHKNLIYRSRETPFAVYADPALSAQILRNLISNAIRYTERGGVLIGCRNRGQFAVVEVWDTGIGIPQAQTEEIFREFHQLGNPQQDRQKGLGLGLAIVKGLAKTMGVEVTVVSKAGQGSVFRLSLPLAADRSEAIIHDIETEELIIDLNGERILVIDDDLMVLEGMRVLLASWRCVVDCAETIEAALALANIHPPDLVITDYRLRDAHTGREAIAVLRENISRTLPAIIITGDIAPERLREALTTDAVLLHKPVVASQLNAAMVRILMKH
jgi:CheY-like chemotaxis protein